MGKLTPYKEIISELKGQGLGSVKIKNYLKANYDLDVNDRSIRKFVEDNKLSNKFEEKLGDNKFNPVENWEYGWLKTKDASIMIRNKAQEISLEDYEEAIKTALKEVKTISVPDVSETNKKALRAVISDAHVGMEPNNKEAAFGFEYNEKIFHKNLIHLFKTLKGKIKVHGAFDLIIVDDLGDGLDGFNGETTRGGHKLPQNMSNKEAWQTYVNYKLETYINIIKLGASKKYQFRNVSNCNHSGDFGWTANKAIKMVLEKMYPNVEYIIMDRHIEHFEYGKHCFLLAHGKDKNNMTRNFPLHLNPKVSNFIRQYIDHHEIKAKYIHVDKGDLHQVGYDREPLFDYRNFMSFAPPSQWVQANFGVSYCGYSVQIIPKDSNDIEHSDIFFDLKKI